MLGSPTAILTASGTLYGAHLYGPYGTVRYSTGNWPAAGGYTGQWSDGPTGLNYDVARYYDTGVGDFVSADTINAGLDRYAYVGDNPETLTDPSGHCAQTDAQGGAGSLQCGSGTGSGCGAYQTCPTNPNPTNPYPTPTPTPTSGGSDNQGGASQSGLAGWIETFILDPIGWTLNGAGFTIALKQHDVEALLEKLKDYIYQLFKVGLKDKDTWKWVQASGDTEAAKSFGELLSKAAEWLTVAGFLTDVVTYAVAYYNSNDRQDLAGEDRVATAIGAGLIHGAITTLSVMGGSAVVEAVCVACGPLAIWGGGFLGGLLGSHIADELTPVLVNTLEPMQGPAIAYGN